MSQVIEPFKAFYQDLCNMPWQRFDGLYDHDLVFRDPVHEVRGSAQLMAYLEATSQHLSFGRFEYLDQLVGEDTAYIKWNMHFSHPRYPEGIHTVRGMSHLQFNERITFHEDVYDLGQMVYEFVPVLGWGTRFMKRRLASM